MSLNIEPQPLQGEALNRLLHLLFAEEVATDGAK